MENIEELISKFWSGSADEKEKQSLYQYLTHHNNEWRTLLKQKYIQEEGEDQQLLGPERSLVILSELHRQINKGNATTNKRSIHFKWLRFVAAASILVAFTAGFFWYSKQRSLQQPSIVKNAMIQKELLDSNSSNKEKIIQLIDGSVVKLQPHSSIRYSDQYNNVVRNISLIGEAIFKVAKDSSRPFTVYANRITTTALGTQFRVKAINNDEVHVQLFEGKVVIKSVDNNFKMKDFFLVPGQSFSANKLIGKTELSGIKNEEKNKETCKKSAIIEFKQEPLATVFKTLENNYNIKIAYHLNDIHQMRFTGRINRDEQVEQIINNIALLNNLSIVKTNKGFTVNK